MDRGKKSSAPGGGGERATKEEKEDEEEEKKKKEEEEEEEEEVEGKNKRLFPRGERTGSYSIASAEPPTIIVWTEKYARGARAP